MGTVAVLRSVHVTGAPSELFNELVVVTLWRSLLCSLQKFPPAIQRYQDLQIKQNGHQAAG